MAWNRREGRCLDEADTKGSHSAFSGGCFDSGTALFGGNCTGDTSALTAYTTERTEDKSWYVHTFTGGGDRF